MKKCEGHLKYKGVKPPVCNNGDPCSYCKKIYITNQLFASAYAMDAIREEIWLANLDRKAR